MLIKLLSLTLISLLFYNCSLSKAAARSTSSEESSFFTCIQGSCCMLLSIITEDDKINYEKILLLSDFKACKDNIFKEELFLNFENESSLIFTWQEAVESMYILIVVLDYLTIIEAKGKKGTVGIQFRETDMFVNTSTNLVQDPNCFLYVNFQKFTEKGFQSDPNLVPFIPNFQEEYNRKIPVLHRDNSQFKAYLSLKAKTGLDKHLFEEKED